jgi:hypothetical protein
MKKTASPRNNYKGGYCGEGFLPIVKPTIKLGLRVNWQSGITSNLLRERTLAMIAGRFTDTEKQERLEYRVYSNHAQISGSWYISEPISLVQVNNDVYLAAYVSACELGVLGVVMERIDCYCECNEMYYFCYRLTEDTQNIGRNSQYVGALLLPLLNNNGFPSPDEARAYTCIDSNWNYLVDSNGTMGLNTKY